MPAQQAIDFSGVILDSIFIYHPIALHQSQLTLTFPPTNPLLYLNIIKINIPP
jgi:hypothetical protein